EGGARTPGSERLVGRGDACPGPGRVTDTLDCGDPDSRLLARGPHDDLGDRRDRGALRVPLRISRAAAAPRERDAGGGWRMERARDGGGGAARSPGSVSPPAWRRPSRAR